MMVQESRGVDQFSLLLKNLDQAATKLTEISGKKEVSQNEIKELMSAIDHVNSALGSSGLKDKKVVPEEMNAKIEKALNAVAPFLTAGLKNPQQAITSAQQAIISFSSSTQALKDFDKNLRDLKKHRIGRRVEKTTETKESKFFGG